MFKKHQIYFLFFILIFLLIIYRIFRIPSDPFVFIYNLIILLYSLVGLMLMPNRYYSLTKVVYFFIFFFFGIIPLNDELKNNVYWNFKPLNVDAYQDANFLILFGLIFFSLGNFVTIKKIDYFDNLCNSNFKLSTKFYFLSFLTLSLVSYLILKDSDFNILRLLTRDTPLELLKEDYTSQYNSISTSIFFDTFIKPFPILFLLIYNFHYQSLKIKTIFSKIFLIILFFLSLILVSPTSLTRFMVAALYIPFIIHFSNLWNKPYRLQFSLLISLFFIFPLLNLFRYFNSEEFNLDIIKHFDFTFLDSGNFDAYQNFARTINQDFITFGSQLSVVFLFFIPRSIWPSKPYGSGSTLAEINGQSFGNISMPYMAEGYVNFGFLGVALFMFILGVILNSLDYKFWNNKTEKSTPFTIYYSMLIGLIFFIMRGDLLSSFTYTVGLTISFIVTLKIFKFLT
jgi:oligosaccharide repeat unit polymerase